MYQAGSINTSSLEALGRSLEIELNKLSLSISQPASYFALKTIYAPPSRIFDGMVVKADGTTWNPGSGAGFYGYHSGTWNKLG